MDESEEKTDLARTVRDMYNAHPFPNRTQILPNRNDERFRSIQEDFVHLPFDWLAGRILLDAGCGTGENTWAWRRIVDPTTKVIAVDHSRSSVRIAKNTHTLESNPPIFSVGSLLDLGLASKSVDVVFCSGVLVAVTEPERAFRELVRVLKPGGYMIIVLYHRYGRMAHGFRRAVVDLFEKEDPDRRSKLGLKLFGRSMRKMAEAEQVPLEGVLYDQFGLPCESRYSVGKALQWFDKYNIRYTATFPPVEWSQFGNALRFSNNFQKRYGNKTRDFLMKLFPANNQPSTQAPSLLSRITMEALWGLDQLQLFTIAGRKE